MKRFLRMSYLVASVGGVGFFAMSVLLLGVWPGRVLQQQIRSTSPEHPLALTAAEQRGRIVYGQDGCAYCHTQQIRYLERDVRRFGRSTLAWETVFDYPHLWGTRRIGPDLSREYSIHTLDWEYQHLYAPRSVVADSVMPSFAWLFDGAPERPKQAARDVVAYLETLGRDRTLAGPEGEAHARAACNCSDDEKRFGFDPKLLNASAELPRRSSEHPRFPASNDRALGLRLYARNCASCHGKTGEGNGPGADGLRPHPRDLAEHEYTPDRLSAVLWNGSPGSAMPAWRDVPLEDLAAIELVAGEFHHAEQARPFDSQAGAQVYADNCSQCHGEKGAGDGYAANQFSVPPTDFQAERPSLAATLRALHDGLEGTPMAPFRGRLTESEINDVAGFVRSFFRTDK
jgi:cbb3-type cytochrome oxidase cytochrome c subunit/mono/diheme cytochrome c family protein